MWQIRCAVEVGESYVVLGNSGPDTCMANASPPIALGNFI
jgi:hypothetical protein